jgi:hypothetical protein
MLKSSDLGSTRIMHAACDESRSSARGPRYHSESSRLLRPRVHEAPINITEIGVTYCDYMNPAGVHPPEWSEYFNLFESGILSWAAD